MSITIKLRIMRGPSVLTNEMHTVNPSDTVLSLKEAVKATHGFTVSAQNLHCNESLMQNDKTFAFYGVGNGDLLYDLLVGA